MWKCVFVPYASDYSSWLVFCWEILDRTRALFFAFLESTLVGVSVTEIDPLPFVIALLELSVVSNIVDKIFEIANTFRPALD